MSEETAVPEPSQEPAEQPASVQEGQLDESSSDAQLNPEVQSNSETRPNRQGVASMVDEPAKVMRIGTMVRQLLEEVKAEPLDLAARERLAQIHQRSIKELEDGLSPDLVEELERLSLPFTEESVPSESELRIAQAQLVGWLEGLFHGIQTVLAAQQMANQQKAAALQLRQLPRGTVIAPGVVIGENGEPQRAPVPSATKPAEDSTPGPGQYL